MQLNKLTLRDFRNYPLAEIDFSPGVNLICGENAQGKTNLLEAIGYLATGRAFRTRREQELIRFGADFCELEAEIFSEERVQILRAVLFSGRQRRQLWRNGVKQKTAAGMTAALNTVLFCPEDLLVLKSGAAARRRLIDQTLCQLRPNYEQALLEYNRLLEHKSRILRDGHENPQLYEVLPEFNERMAEFGAVVIAYRARYLRTLAERAAAYHADFSGGRETLSLVYQTVSNIDDPFAPETQLCERLRAHQQSHDRAERESGQCLSGPHKDDFDAQLGGLSIRAYGSQGQTRTAAISIKLAERALFLLDTGSEPVLLLDDVLSELDPGRQDFVLNQIKTGQVFITCCERDRRLTLGRVYTVENGRIRAEVV